MNASFFIYDDKFKGELTRKEILDVVHPITQCQFDPNSTNLELYLSHKMNEGQVFFLGQKGVSARGFNFTFDKQSNKYCINLPLPCSNDDFKVVFDFIKKICAFLDTNKVFTTDGKEYVVQNKDKFSAVFEFLNNIAFALGKNNKENTTLYLEDYPCKAQIVLSLNKTLQVLKQQTKRKSIELSGINRPVAFNEKMLADIINSDDMVKKFSEFFTDIQNLDAFSAHQKIFSGKYIAIYALKENEITILPFKPKVDPEAVLRGTVDDVSHFEVDIFGISDKSDENEDCKLGRIKYSDFIERLPKDKYSFIDANQILIEKLSRQDLEKLLFK